MRREELAHILRACCAIAGDNEVLVVGSQAILGTYDESELPEVVTLSREADIAFLHDPDRRKADDVEGAIGEMSAFHDTYQVYAEGVHIDTAELPAGCGSGWAPGTSGRVTPRLPGSSSLTTWSSASLPRDGKRTSRSRQACWMRSLLISAFSWLGLDCSPRARDE